MIVPATGVGASSGVVADFNGDGLPDIGILSIADGGSFSDTIAILVNFSHLPASEYF